MKKKIYFIQPSYRDQNGDLLKGKNLYIVSLSLPALSGVVPEGWQKEFCYEYFNDVNFDTDASVIGISCMGYEIFRGVEIAKEFRKRGKIVLFGGFQPHISREYVEPYCDSLIHGNPGMKEMAGILNDAELNTLKKEYYCKTDLDYKFDYSVLDSVKVSFTPVLLGVGCRNNCDYCCIGAIYKGEYFLRKFSHVEEDLEYLYKKTKNIAFVDTNIYNNREYLNKICAHMINRNYNFIWGAQCTIDIGDDKEVLNNMRKAGCRVLFIGMESTEQSNLDAVNKKYNVDAYQQKINNIHKAGIRIAGFFMYGLDSDTVNTSSTLSKFIIENKIALPMLNILVPTPGTRLYDKLKKENRILMKDEQEFLKNNPAYNSSFNLCFYTPKNMTPAQVEDGFIDLLGRLSGFGQILRRSVSTDIPLTIFLLYNNWIFRKEYIVLKRKKAIMNKTASK